MRWKRNHRDLELDEEIRSHIRLAIQDRVRHGEDREQARTAVMKEFMQQLFNVQADLLTLQTALIESGVLTQAQLAQAHEKVAVQLKAVQDSLAAATPEKLLELLDRKSVV